MHRLRVIEQSLGALHTTEKVVAPCAVERGQLAELVALCRAVVFPQYYTQGTSTRSLLNNIGVILTEQLVNGFALRETFARRSKSANSADDAEEPQLPRSYRSTWEATRTRSELYRQCAESITDEFLLCRLPKVKALLKLDVDALYYHDVAAESKCEVVLCYPGIVCMLHQRIAHELYLLGAPNNVTRMMTEMAHSLTGIDIHPQTQIGHHFFVDHGTGVVIGATAIIGNNVCIYQGVTLGAKSFPSDDKGQKIKFLPRHPVIEDGVTIYSNAVVLGRITIGRNSVIAGNAWVTNSVPPNSTVLQTHSKVVKGAGNATLFHVDGGGI